MLRSVVLFLSAAVFSAATLAAGTVTSVRGDVRADGKAVAAGEKLAGPKLLETGPGARLVLRLDDGGQVALHEESLLRIVDWRYRERDPQADRAIFNLDRGAARFTTGAIAARSPASWSLRAPQATVNVRGDADFIASLVNPLYVRVLDGTVVVVNASAAVPVTAVSNIAVAHANALATPIALGALPGPALTAFSSLGTVPMTVAGGPASGAVTTTTPGGLSTGMIAAVAAVLVGVAAAAGGGGGGSAPSH